MSIIKKFMKMTNTKHPKKKQTLAQKAVELYKKTMSRRLPRCGKVWCCDCLAEGYFDMLDSYFDRTKIGEYHLTEGWQLVFVGLKPYFICGECQRKRREWAMEFMK